MSATPRPSARRIFLGLAVVVAVGLLSDIVLPANNTVASAAADSGLSLFVAITIGAYVARSGFLVPAILLAVAGWSAAIYIAWRIGQLGNPPATLRDIVLNNLMVLAVTLIAAGAGAQVGMRLAARRIDQSNITQSG